RPLTAKTPDFWAPLGVCKVENAQNCAFSLSFGLKPHRLIGNFQKLQFLEVFRLKIRVSQPVGLETARKPKNNRFLELP
ncbi:MAG: hypothetical protein LBG57_12280, partial [Treponema sp.]|nr:hypothetical protein [Treponema sp.]